MRVVSEAQEMKKRREKKVKITRICLLVIVGNNKKRDCFLMLSGRMEEWLEVVEKKNQKKR